MNPFRKYLKKLFSDLHSAIVCIIITAAILSVGGIWVFYEKLWALFKTRMLSSTPLWITATLFVLFVLAYLYLRNRMSVPLSTPDPGYREEYHVFWDKDDKMRCLNCGKPLKYSSSDSDPSMFFCSDPRCNSKHILKDKHGHKITEQQAIDLMNTNK